MKFFSLEGNIASGKSTLIKQIESNKTSYLFIMPEPVNSWINLTDNGGKSILQNFYEDQKKYAFTFQIYALFTRFQILKDIIESAKKFEEEHGIEAVILSERTLNTDYHIFASMLYEDNVINEIEYKVYTEWFNEFNKIEYKNQPIYIVTEPKSCLQRIAVRGREDEEAVTLGYLQKCHDKHDQIYLSNSIIIDNTNIDDIDSEEYTKMYDQIMDIILPSKDEGL